MLFVRESGSVILDQGNIDRWFERVWLCDTRPR